MSHEWDAEADTDPRAGHFPPLPEDVPPDAVADAVRSGRLSPADAEQRVRAHRARTRIAPVR